VVTNVVCPVKQLDHLARVDELRWTWRLPAGLAYHFIPQRPNLELVVCITPCCTLDDDPSPRDVGYGLQRTIQALLREGYGSSAYSCRTCGRGLHRRP